MYLEKIASPDDVKKLNVAELEKLSEEIRENLLKKLSEHGGHIGPNLGIVEVTVALHYVFNSPKDKIVYDVSHQSYVHKMLTGRKDAFMNPKKYDDVSGYSNPEESKHDFFEIGHTSTSVSLACGLAKARDLKEEKGNIIALIGDGSLSGGEAYEGLNNVAEQGTNMIVIVNDNDMSIAENHGGLYSNLKLKGKGFKPAELHKEQWHWGMPFELATGEPKFSMDGEDFGNLTAEYLLKKMEEDKKVVAITSGTPTVFGFTEDRRKKAKKQFVDVGIAEEHAVALASGIAKNGGRPIFQI